MEDPLGFLDDEAHETTEGVSPEAPETVVEAAPEPVETVEEATSTDVKEEEVTAPSADDEPVKQGQFHALLAEREKRQNAERERAQLQAQIAELRAQSQPQIDPDLQPEEYRAQQQAVAEHQRNVQEATTSELITRGIYEAQGKPEVVDQALEWAKSTGAISYFLQGPARWQNMVKAYQQVQKTQEANTVYEAVGGDIEAYKAKVIADHMATLTSRTPTQPRAPRGTFAAVGSEGAPEAVETGSAFDQAFSD